VEAGPGVQPPLRVKSAEPVYPPLAKKARRTASVVVRALVDEEGRVVQAEIARGDASKLGFDEAALAAARQMLFRPASKDGVPVKIWVELPITFRP
jgi:protein TonB